jgi:hypothetical protein
LSIRGTPVEGRRTRPAFGDVNIKVDQMGRRSDVLSRPPLTSQAGRAGPDAMQVVQRAFDILRCFDGPNERLGNGELASRSGLPRSTVSRLVCTLTQLDQLVYFPDEMKYGIGPRAVEMSLTIIGAPDFHHRVAPPLGRLRAPNRADRR